jgi:hypothetical protein
MTRRLLPSEKRQRGTSRPDRDGHVIEFIVEPDSLPVEPEGLTEGGRSVWLDLVPHCAGQLATARDSMLLGQLCNLVGACNTAWASGSAPPAAFLSELRKLSELFGLAGRRSRLGVLPIGKLEPNPFTRNGRPDRAEALFGHGGEDR